MTVKKTVFSGKKCVNFVFTNPERTSVLRGFNFANLAKNLQNSQELILAKINPLEVFSWI